MTTVSVDLDLDAAELAWRLAPRDDAVVKERLSASEAPPTPTESAVEATGTTANPMTAPGVWVFHAEHGPWRTYERRVEVTPTNGGRFTVHERTNAKMDVPVWGPAFTRLARRDLARRAVQRSMRHGPTKPPWYGPAVRMAAKDTRTLGVCCTISVIGGFLSGLVGRVMTYTVADQHASASAPRQSEIVANALSNIRIGVLAAFLALALADRVGRKTVIVWSCTIGIATCAISAAAPSLNWFVSAQIIARSAAAVITVLVAVVVAEELPAMVRAYATGMLGMSFALGAGGVLAAFPLAGVAPWGWRLVTATVLLLVPVLAYVLPKLPETKRFSAVHDRPNTAPTKKAASRLLNRSFRFPEGFPAGRLALMALLFLALNVATAPATQLQTDYLRTVRGYSPGLSSLFILLTNFPGAIGVLVGGRLSDVHGRKALATIGMIGITLQSVLFMVGGVSMWTISIASALIGGCAVPTLAAFGPELFPTRWRTTANGFLHTASIIGGLIGLRAAGSLIADHGYGPTFAVLGACVILAAIILQFLPETAHRELEDISPDAAGPSIDRATFSL